MAGDHRVSQFLESQGLKEQALQMSTDTDHRFDLAVQLGLLEMAEEIAKEADSEHKWRQLGDLALSSCKVREASCSVTFLTIQLNELNTVIAAVGSG
jgi:hypothetical protein